MADIDDKLADQVPAADPPKRKRGRPFGSKTRDFSRRGVSYLKFGSVRQELKHLKAKHGEDWVTKLGRDCEPLQNWIDHVIESKGGADACTPQMQAAIRQSAMSLLLIEMVNAQITRMPSIFMPDGRIHPILMERKELVNNLGRQFADIGLKKEKVEADKLWERVKQKYAHQAVAELAGPEDGVGGGGNDGNDEG